MSEIHRLEEHIIQVDTEHKPIKGSTVFNCVLLEHAKRFAEQEKKQGAIEATQSCYFAERQFLSEIAELERKEHGYGASYRILEICEEQLKVIEKRLKELEGKQ